MCPTLARMGEYVLLLVMMMSAVNAPNLTKEASARNILDKLIQTSNPLHALIIPVLMGASALLMEPHFLVPAGNLDSLDLSVRS